MSNRESGDTLPESITRARYMRSEVTFSEYYGALVELLGEDALRGLLPVKQSPSSWRALLAADEHLNNVPLRKWDALDYFVRVQVQRNLDAVEAISGSRGWSLSDSVCVLKETARRYAAVSA